MDILYIIHDNKKGGAAVSFLNMIEGVSKGHDVYVLTPHKKAIYRMNLITSVYGIRMRNISGGR